MDMDEYQQRARETAVYPLTSDLRSINYCVLGLGGETGEVLNAWKKTHRGDYNFRAARGKLLEEAGDALWYIANLAHELGLTLSELAEINLIKLKQRQADGNIKGEHSSVIILEEKEDMDYSALYDLPEREVRRFPLGEPVDPKEWQKWVDGDSKSP